MFCGARLSEKIHVKANTMRVLFLISIPLLFLSACGFRPVYGKAYQAERAQASAALSEVQVQVGTSRYAQLLGAELRDRLNPEHAAVAKRYVLDVSVEEVNVPLFVAPDGTYGRGNLRYTLNYTLKHSDDNRVLDDGQIVRMSSYAASETNAIYASFVAQEDARKRGMIELANELSMRVGNVLDAKSDSAPITTP